MRLENSLLKRTSKGISKNNDLNFEEALKFPTTSPDLTLSATKQKNNEELANLLEDLSAEQTKLYSRINLLSEELEKEKSASEQQLKKIQRNCEFEQEQRLNNELKSFFANQQAFTQKSHEFLQENQEKLEYYQNFSAKLRQQLETIEAVHGQELEKVKELAATQLKKSLEAMALQQEITKKTLISEKVTELEEQKSYISQLEECVKGLYAENEGLRSQIENIVGEKELLRRELSKIYELNLRYQTSMDEFKEFHEEKLQEIKEKYSDEKNSLTFQLKSLKGLVRNYFFV